MSTPQAAADGLVDGAGDKDTTMETKRDDCAYCNTGRTAYPMTLSTGETIECCQSCYNANRARSADTAAARIEAEYCNRLRAAHAREDAETRARQAAANRASHTEWKAREDASTILNLELRLGALEAAARNVLDKWDGNIGGPGKAPYASIPSVDLAALRVALKGAR